MTDLKNSFKPFSAIYFVKENLPRCIVLIFMLFLGYFAYLGGLYVTNPRESTDYSITLLDKTELIAPSFDAEDYDIDELMAVISELENEENLEVIGFESENNFSVESIMGFSCYCDIHYTFKSVEDLVKYCDYLGIEIDKSKLSDKSVIMTEILARNVGASIGDKLEGDKYPNIESKGLVLSDCVDMPFYMFLAVDSEISTGLTRIVIGKNGATIDDVVATLSEYVNEGKINIFMKYNSDEFSIFNTLYYFVIIFMAIIAAITINAAFVVLYQKRKPEFAVYRGIGISKGQIVRKIAGEILILDAIALTLGAGITALTLYLLNSLLLYPKGMYLSYINTTALLGLVICNLFAVVPLIIMRSKKAIKADITEF